MQLHWLNNAHYKKGITITLQAANGAYPWWRHARGWHAWPLRRHARSEASRGHELRGPTLAWRPLCKLWGWHAWSRRSTCDQQLDAWAYASLAIKHGLCECDHAAGRHFMLQAKAQAGCLHHQTVLQKMYVAKQSAAYLAVQEASGREGA